MFDINLRCSVSNESDGSALGFSHLRFGAVGIFLYVGAEAAIGSFLINFIGLPGITGKTESQAAHYVAYYWGGAMIGRFIGAVVMRYIGAGKLLAFNAISAIVCISIAIISSGELAMWAILAVGLFNSIMFPTIFSLAITGLGHHAGNGSGILCLAIVGGGYCSFSARNAGRFNRGSISLFVTHIMLFIYWFLWFKWL